MDPIQKRLPRGMRHRRKHSPRQGTGQRRRNSAPLDHSVLASIDDAIEQARADDRIRDEVERTGGIWARMTVEHRAQLLARLRDKKQRAQAARARKQAEQWSLEE